MKKKNEIDACNAAIKMLAKVTGTKYEIDSFPDENGSGKKDVDFILKSTHLGEPKIALEHTIMPSFKGQIGYVVSFFNRAEKLNELCRDKIPTDRFFYLSAPHELINSLGDRKRQQEFDQTLSHWISQQAPCLQIDEFERYNYEGWTVTLTCGGTHPSVNGKVGRMPESPANLMALQYEAFDIAIQHGLNKFPQYKDNPSESFKTVLLLEDVAGLGHEQTLDWMTLDYKNQIDSLVDYIFVAKSFADRMVVGYVWKENEIWHRFIPANRRFTFE